MGMMRGGVAVVIAGVVVVMLAGCGGTSQVSPSPTPLGNVSTIDELRDAFVGAGGVCNWDQDDVVQDATASGTCSDQTVLMLFADPADKTAVVARIGGFTTLDVHLLVGENWIINSPEAMDMQEQLGGKVVENDAP